MSADIPSQKPKNRLAQVFMFVLGTLVKHLIQKWSDAMG
jgi:hypothetical protein